MSRTSKQAAEISFQHLLRTERVVRTECERKEAKARLRLIDTMSSDVEEQLMYVAQFKQVWITHRKQLEHERRAVLEEENTARSAIEEEYVSQANNIIRKHHPFAIVGKTRPARSVSLAQQRVPQA